MGRPHPESDFMTPSANPPAPRILIVDDDSGVRSICKFALGAARFECDEAEEGKAALAAVGRADYDLALLDGNLPHLTGPDAAAKLRAASHKDGLRVIVISGDPEPADPRRTWDDYLAKPFGLDALVERVRGQLRGVPA